MDLVESGRIEFKRKRERKFFQSYIPTNMFSTKKATSKRNEMK